MVIYSADPAMLRLLAGKLEHPAATIAGHCRDVGEVLLTHGYLSEAASTCAQMLDCVEWGERWTASLCERAAILERDAALPLARDRAGGDRHSWALQLDWALSQVGPSYATWAAQRGASAAQRFRRVREELLSLPDASPHSRDIRAELVALAGDLNLAPAGFSAAALAMIDGESPVSAGIDLLYFPQWYVDVHDEHRRLLLERRALAARAQLLWDKVTEVQLSGGPHTADIQRLADEALALSSRAAEVGKLADVLEARLTVEPLEVAAYLSTQAAIGVSQRTALLGELAASQVETWAGQPRELAHVAQLVGRYVTTTDASVAFVNALPDGLIAALPAATQTESNSELIAPFAHALALASHSDDLDLEAAAIVDEPSAGYWFIFGAEQYNTQFLVAAAVNAIRAGDPWQSWTFDEAWLGGETSTLDPRVLLLDELNRRGPDTAERLIEAVKQANLFEKLIDPVTAYSDGGRAVGVTLALLGTGMDKNSASLILEAMYAVVASKATAPVLRGAAMMAAPHVGSFASGLSAETIAPTLLRDALDRLPPAERDQVVRTFLDHTMRDDVAAQHMFDGLSVVIAGAFGAVLKGDVDLPLSEPAWEVGLLADLFAGSYLDARYAAAVSEDRAAALLHAVSSTAIDLVLAAGIAALGPGIVAGIVLEILAATANNIGVSLVGGFGVEGSRVVDVLASGYDVENLLVLDAALIVAVGLQDRGVVELPTEWFHGGQLVRPSMDSFLDWLDAIETPTFKPSSFFGPVFAIGGLVGSEGPPDGS